MVIPILFILSLACLAMLVSILVLQVTVGDAGGSSPPGVDGIPPLAIVAGDVIANNGEATILNGSRSTDNVGVVNWTWFFIYDERDYTIYGERTTFDFDEPGTYSVQLTVRDGAGNQNSTVFTVTVEGKEVQSAKGVNPMIWPVAGTIIIVILVLSLALVRRSGPAKPVGEDPYHLHP
jgi:hypothetical protein